MKTSMLATTRALSAGVALAAVLVTAGCTSSSHKASGSSTPAGSASSASSAAGSSTAGSSGAGPSSSSSAAGSSGAVGPKPTTSSANSTAAPYPTPSGQHPSPIAEQSVVLNAMPGSASTSCASVGNNTNFRSGGLASGDWVAARKSFASQFGKTEVPAMNLYVIPQHSATMTKVVITIAPTGPGTTTSYTSTSAEQADQYSYYAVSLPIRNPGTYRLSMVAGADKGCFEVTFAK
jgi:hypothetical protein